jgi:GNAT superfamily N-acetyltransferase
VERKDAPLADLLEPVEGASVQDLRDACLRELRGWTVVAPVELARALIAAGARPRRHARLMTHDLRELPAAVDARIVPLTAGAAGLMPAHRAAYGPDHPDHAIASQDDPLGALLSGQLVGPLLACSRMAVVDDAIAGAAIVNDFPGEPPVAGPWLSEIFRDPAHRGVGRALLRAVLTAAAADGHPALGLVVSHGNPAAELYLAEGFRTVREDISVDVPG